MNERAAVYRLYDATGTLLYIGVANRPEERWRAHASEKRWWGDVSRKTVEWHPDRAAAEAAEDAAIPAENPVYNIMYPAPGGNRRMRRDAPAEAWASGMPHWETRYGGHTPLPRAAKKASARKEKMPMHLIRVEPDLWRDYGLACAELGTNRSKDIRALMERTVKAWRLTQKKGAERDADG